MSEKYKYPRCFELICWVTEKIPYQYMPQWVWDAGYKLVKICAYGRKGAKEHTTILNNFYESFYDNK